MSKKLEKQESKIKEKKRVASLPKKELSGVKGGGISGSGFLSAL